MFNTLDCLTSCLCLALDKTLKGIVGKHSTSKGALCTNFYDKTFELIIYNNHIQYSYIVRIKFYKTKLFYNFCLNKLSFKK